MALPESFDGPPWLMAWLDWIALNPVQAALLLAFAVAVEGLFLVGMLIPGSLLMFAAGAIAVAGEFPLWPVMLIAAIGAWIGDALSYYIGFRFRHQLPAIARRLHMPNAIGRGEQFFARHGGKSIVLGRFVGPLRPLVPAIAGAAAMRPAQFLAVDFFAALLWAPAYALPGVVVGATLSLAAEVTSRFAMLMALALGLVWLIWWLIVSTVRLGQAYAEPWLLRTMDWSHKHRRLGTLGPALADPDQPETPILALSLAALALICWLLGQLWWHWPGAPAGPPSIDDTVYEALAALLNDASWPLALYLDALGQQSTNLLVGLGMLILFAGLKHMRLAAHWVAGLVGGGLLGLALPGDGFAISPTATLSPTVTISLSLSLWMCLAGLLATRHTATQRIVVYALVGLLLAALLLAKLMLGQISFSQVVLGLPITLLWCSLLTLGFRRHLRRPRTLPLSGTLILATSLTLASLVLSPPSLPDTHKVAWENAKRSPARVNLHWLGDAAEIQASLQAAGWTYLPPTEKRSFIGWMRPSVDDVDLPLAPQWLAGRRPDLRFIKQTGEQRLILRLWRDPKQRWLGQVGELKVRRWAGLMRVPITLRSENSIRQLVSDQAPYWEVSRTRRETTLYILAAPPQPRPDGG